jgi:SpoVK/Ycf46/Vps4 family AAA+-type ATPase
MAPKTKQSDTPLTIEPLQLVDLWILQIYGRLGATKRLALYGYESAAQTFAKVGFTEQEFDRLLKQGPHRLLPKVASLLSAAERYVEPDNTPPFLRSNLVKLARLVPLNELECRLLEFAVLMVTDPDLQAACEGIDPVSVGRMYKCLAVILKVEEAAIAHALSRQGALHRSSLLSVDRDANLCITARLQLCNSSFAQNALMPTEDEIELLRDHVAEAPPAHLSLQDFGHLGQRVDLLRALLQSSLSGQYRPANVLIYGPPGTGKTQLVRAMAQHLDCRLLEVVTADEAGGPAGPLVRLNSLRLAQTMLDNSRSMVLFDEVEDIFIDDQGGRLASTSLPPMKGWLNRQLETNHAPTFWLTNDIEQIDRAFLRRFDMILEMPVPPRQQRKKILQHVCGQVLSAERIEALAGIDELAPAVATRAAEVVLSLGDRIKAENRELAVHELVSATLKAQGFKKAARLPVSICAAPPYDTCFVNASHDLGRMAHALRGRPAGRLLLYGPPGTGKTAYAQWLGRELEKPVVSKRASDLSSAYWGETEERIASAFRQAAQEDSVLLIDEADSFLQDRTSVEYSWRVPMINEMLTQMESFEGLLILTTNAVDSLDKASIRRFDFKVSFGAMRPSQAHDLLLHYAVSLGMAEGGANVIARLQQLNELTPGDFAAVARQHRLVPFADSGAFVEALQQECRLKHPASSPMGFVHAAH